MRQFHHCLEDREEIPSRDQNVKNYHMNRNKDSSWDEAVVFRANEMFVIHSFNYPGGLEHVNSNNSLLG